MNSKIRTPNLTRLCVLEAPPLLVALAIADTYFKFGGFVWEAVPFLVLWWALRCVYKSAIMYFRP